LKRRSSAVFELQAPSACACFGPIAPVASGSLELFILALGSSAGSQLEVMQLSSRRGTLQSGVGRMPCYVALAFGSVFHQTKLQMRRLRQPLGARRSRNAIDVDNAPSPDGCAT